MIPRTGSNAVAALAVFLIVPTIATGQGVGVEPVNDWTAEPGGRASVETGVLTVRRGLIRTTRLYSDFVLRFEFRFNESDTEGRVFVRSRFGYGVRERGYRVDLTNRTDGDEALGRISAADARMQKREFTPAQVSDVEGAWHAFELRAERDQVTVWINNRIVSVADSLDEFSGYIALQARRGSGIQFRNILAERLPSADDSFGRGAYRADEPGVTLPRLRREVKPFYPKEPHDAWIQGAVSLEAVVDATGRPGEIRVTKSLHPDLDEAAIAAVRRWEFDPGTVCGQAVPVIVTIDISFRRTR